MDDCLYTGVLCADMPKLTSRRAILAGMSAGAAALAGCLVEDDGEEPAASTQDNPDNETDDGTDDDTGENSGEESTTALLDSSMYHQWSDCGGGEAHNDGSVVRDGAVFLVDGITDAPNPCHTAVLEDAGFEDGALTFSVAVAHEEQGEQEMACIDCHGLVGYNALAAVESPEAVERVLVSHGDEEFEVPPEEFSTAGHVYDRNLEMVETACGTEGVDKADITVEDGTVTATGTVSKSNPCHEAFLHSAAVQEGTLRMDIGFRSLDEACEQCLGELRYEATASVLNMDAVDEVVVSHEYGEDHSFDL